MRAIFCFSDLHHLSPPLSFRSHSRNYRARTYEKYRGSRRNRIQPSVREDETLPCPPTLSLSPFSPLSAPFWPSSLSSTSLRTPPGDQRTVGQRYVRCPPRLDSQSAIIVECRWLAPVAKQPSLPSCVPVATQIRLVGGRRLLSDTLHVLMLWRPLRIKHDQSCATHEHNPSILASTSHPTPVSLQIMFMGCRRPRCAMQCLRLQGDRIVRAGMPI